MQEAGIGEVDLEAVISLLPDIARQTPKTDTASLRLRRVLMTVTDPVFQEVLNRALAGIACQAAMVTLGIARAEASKPKRER